MAAKRGIFVAPFDEMADPRLLMELSARAEEKGWDGFFLWDHIRYRAPTRSVLDPWVALSAIAVSTERIRIGPMVTPISRRRPHKLARETITLDHLSRGRLTLGVGLGSDHNGELEPFGEEADPKARARLLDDGLDKLAGYWAGEFEPPPVQTPRIPVWVASRWPNRRPLRRAAKWDGLFPIELPHPDALGELARDLADLRRDDRDRPFDLVIEVSPGGETAAWEEAGATWILTSFGQSPLERDVRAAIEAGA